MEAILRIKEDEEGNLNIDAEFSERVFLDDPENIPLAAKYVLAALDHLSSFGEAEVTSVD